MKLNKLGAFIAVITIVLGGALLASALDLFAVESEKEAAVIKTGDFAGLADPNDIRGSYSFGDIESNFGVSPQLLAKAFAIEGTAEEIDSYQCKGLEEKYVDAPEEIGTSSVRLFVAFLLGMPVELGPFLPESAVKVLMESAVSITPEREQYLKEHTIIIEDGISVMPADVDISGVQAETAAGEPIKNEPKPAAPADPAPAKVSATQAKKEEVQVAAVPASNAAQSVVAAEPAPAQSPANTPEATNQGVSSSEDAPAADVPADVPAVVAAGEHISSKEAGTVKGSTTIYDMMSWGVKREQIGPALGIELPADNGAKLKDLIAEAGKSFEELKAILQKMVDEAK